LPNAHKASATSPHDAIKATSQAKALHRVTGSLAFVAAARMVFLVVEEPETGRRLFLPAKNNLAAMPEGLAYRLEQRFVCNKIPTSCVVWDPERVTVTADQALVQRLTPQ
jgi:putative DNA primase/helicase